MLRRFTTILTVLLAALVFAVDARGQQYRIDVLTGTPAGPGGVVTVAYTFDCTGTMPRTLSFAVAGGRTAVQVAMDVATGITAGTAGQGCAVGTAGLTATAAGTSVNVDAAPGNGLIRTLQTTAAAGLALKVNTTSGDAAKAGTTSGTAAGGTVTVNVNPVVTVVTFAGQSSTQVVLALSTELTNVGFPHTVVPIQGSQCLLDPQVINNTVYLCFPGDPSGVHGVSVTSNDPGLTGISQTTALTAPEDCTCGLTSTVPALGTWGLIVLGSLVAAAGVLIVMRRQG